MPTCPKCNKEFSNRGYRAHSLFCTGVGYVSKTKPRKKKRKQSLKSIERQKFDLKLMYGDGESGNTNDKTAPAAHITATSPQEVVTPGEGAESKSKILTEINIKPEFDKMVTKLNKKEEKKDSKADMKYECGECGIQFNHKAEGNTCPGCGCELE